MPHENYLALRKQIEDSAKTMDQYSPCKKGLGNCCTSHVPVSIDEAQIILEAFSTGEIASSVTSAVKRNLANGPSNKCPFLSDKNTCMIYEKRPLECVDFGRGALIVTDEGSRKAQQISRGIGRDGIKPPDVMPRLCTPCQKKVKPDRYYPLSLLTTSQAVVEFYRAQPVANLNAVAETVVTGNNLEFYAPNDPNSLVAQRYEAALTKNRR